MSRDMTAADRAGAAGPVERSRRNLSVPNAIRETFAAIGRHPRALVRLYWVPFVVSVTIACASALFLRAPGASSGEVQINAARLLHFAGGIVSALALVPALTGWHRTLLPDPERGGRRERYRWSRPEWLYLTSAVILAIIAFVLWPFASAIVALPASYLLSGPSPLWRGMAVTVVATVVVIFLVTFVLVRPALALPRIAAGGDPTLTGAMGVSRGQTWRLTGVIVPVLGVYYVAVQFLALGLESVGLLGDAPAVAPSGSSADLPLVVAARLPGLVIGEIMSIFGWILAATAISVCYRMLTRAPPAEPAPAQSP